MLDVERGQLASIRPFFWQTDTSISKNSWGYVLEQDYKTARDLIGDLIDVVSKNGALLLNIGPRPDGTIPEPEQEILRGIGRWLKTNGEAIYGTRPFSVAAQWSAGERPRIDYDREFETAYDVSKLCEAPPPGRASIEAFFTAKGSYVFAILPRWPGRRFTIRGAAAEGVTSVALLGGGSLRFERSGASLSVDLGELPEALLGQPAWVLKLGR